MNNEEWRIKKMEAARLVFKANYVEEFDSGLRARAWARVRARQF